ncbi:NADH-quinone oxidoreductase subunit N [candidate division KSB1 bacterium]
MDYFIPIINISTIGPEIIIFLTALAVLIISLFPNIRRWSFPVAFIGLVLSFYDIYYLWNRNRIGFDGIVIADNFALIFDLIFLIGTLLTLLLSGNFINLYSRGIGEYISLILIATIGMMLMVSSTDLIVIFLGLETLSISLYILAAFRRNREDSLEAGLKYFLLGAFTTGFLLYGIAFIYGSSGTTNIHILLSFIKNGSIETGILFYIGVVLIIVGFGFKAAVVPFHMWVPDVYEGSATPITAFMSAGAKGASFAVLLRFFIEGFAPVSTHLTELLEILAILTMTVGNIIAIAQDNIKRMLAYSSIAHAGYILIGFTALSLNSGTAGISIIYYIMVYTFMNLGAFGVIIYLEKSAEEVLNISDYAGLGFKKPFVAICLTLFMLSLGGIPPTGGFMGKFYIFNSAVQSGLISLTVIGVLNAVISMYYYLRVVVFMYMKEVKIDFSYLTSKPIMAFSISISVAGVIFLGIYPQSFIDVLKDILQF